MTLLIINYVWGLAAVIAGIWGYYLGHKFVDTLTDV
jgi:hypothetical protein